MKRKGKGKKQPKKQKHKDVFLLFFLLFLLLLLNYSFLDNALTRFLDETKIVHVERVIDGDTIESNGTSIRLLGINTPERSEYLYEEAKKFLEDEILNKTVRLEFTRERYDKYDRLLAYVWLEDENINVKMVENGFANYYFFEGKDRYSGDLLEAWNKCIESKVNLCEPSQHQCSSCINLTQNKLINSCSISCDITNWEIRGEGREKFIFNVSLQPGEQTNFALDLTNTGGSLFLRDDKGKLVAWEGGS